MRGRHARVLAVLPGLLLVGCSSKAAPEPIWLGHLAQMTGPAKWAGTKSQQGVRLAVEEEAAVRVLGRPLAVRHADTRGEPETARAEAVRLIAVSKVAALLVSVDAAQAERIGREALPYGLPVVVCGELASPPGENVFVLGAGPEARGRALARCLADEVKAGTVAVFVDGRDALAGAVAAAFAQQWRKTARRQAEEWEYLNDDDLKERINRAIKARPAAVLVAGSVRDCQRVRADLAAEMVSAPVLFGGPDVDAAALRRGEGGDAVYLATAFAAEGGREFARKFEDTTREPPTVAAVLAYDGTRMLFEAMRDAGTNTGTRVRDQLAKVEVFESVTGKVSFKDRQARRPVFVLRLKGDAVTLVKTVEPD
jgi:branched-chain amino acid transport system substrate-binding protein